MLSLDLMWVDTNKSVDPSHKTIRSRLCAREYKLRGKATFKELYLLSGQRDCITQAAAGSEIVQPLIASSDQASTAAQQTTNQPRLGVRKPSALVRKS